MSDPVYKKLYSSKRMVADLVRAVAPAVAALVDFATLEDLSTEYVGDRGQQRRGDAVWRARLRGGRRHVLILLEFQSGKDGAMALRVLEYTALLLARLRRSGGLGAPGSWPLPLPIVLYNGAAPWPEAVEARDLFAPADAVLRPHLPSQRSLVVDALRASEDDMPPGNLTRAVVGFEKSATPADLGRVAADLLRWLGEDDAQLRRDFGAWVGEMAEALAPGGSRRRRVVTLEEASMTLVERIGEWSKPWLEQGREEGLVQGLEQGLERGLANERALLGRQATRRFGAAAGERLSRTLAGVSDPDRLAEVGDWVVACATADEFLLHIGRLEASGR